MKTKPPITMFLSIERKLHTDIMFLWKNEFKEVLRQIDTLTQDKEYVQAVDLAKSLTLSSSFLGKVTNPIRLATKTAFIFGATRVSPNKATAYDFSHIDKEDKAVTQLKDMLIMVVLPAMIASLVTDVWAMYTLKNTIKADRITDFTSGIDAAANGIASDYAFLTSSLHTSRLSAWGYMLEADLMDVETYAINEQLDNRTCPVCKVMHGKIFNVSDGYRTLDFQLSIDNVMDLKNIAPWAKQDTQSVLELSKMTNAELVSANRHIPPYHPWCRGLAYNVDEVPELSAEAKDSLEKFLTSLQSAAPPVSPVPVTPVPTDLKSLAQAASTVEEFDISLKEANLGVPASTVAAGLPTNLKDLVSKQSSNYINTDWDVSKVIVEGTPPLSLSGNEPAIVVGDNGMLISGHERVLYAMSQGSRTMSALVPSSEVYRDIRV